MSTLPPTGKRPLVSRYNRALGPTYSLFYNDPVTFSSARGAWMYDDNGQRYLDAYNNVPVVGHAHPRVVEAVAQQMAQLNTHTRSLHPEIIRLAERLLATMPSTIEHMIFTCTGSESNDLALRIAKYATGGTGVIVTRNAYHGNTEATMGVSPAAGQHLLAPDTYLVDPPRAGDPLSFAIEVTRALERMRDDGVRPAALLVDTVMSSDGVFTAPAQFLKPAVAAIRAAGGLFIADEVQPGHGRLGTHLWGFQTHDVAPDIVTMGKPTGNGFPMAALGAGADLLAQFRKHSGYFNTFGGSPVAAAAGNAVLDVIEEAGILVSVRETGAYFMDRLDALRQAHPIIRTLRGQGLFIGVELARDGRASAIGNGSRMINAMRRHGVLIGTAGAEGNCLKIRPPLIFKPKHVDHFVEVFGEILTKEVPSW